MSVGSEIEIYSFQSNTWTTFSTSHTGFPAMKFVNQISVDGTIYFMGGYDHALSSNTNYIFVFDPDTVTVNQIGSLKDPVYQSVLILFNHQP